MSVLAAEPGERVLDLCCGDGSLSRRFHAAQAAEVVAVDFDPQATAHARRVNRAATIRFEVADIRDGLPAGPFDHVAWDAAIEHFTEEEIADVLEGIRSVLAGTGILTDYTIVERDEGLSLPQHEREFTGIEDLGTLLRRVFAHVWVFETDYPDRRNMYFYATDDERRLPFSSGHLLFRLIPDGPAA